METDIIIEEIIRLGDIIAKRLGIIEDPGYKQARQSVLDNPSETISDRLLQYEILLRLTEIEKGGE